ncbi:MAG: Crp/Fnr family transcriptional regulator [Eubacteriales bacterium]|nr:Crp/Fnr family transcriptional regulator [Eubacteriales bacterium]
MNKQLCLEKLPYYNHLTDEQKHTILNHWVKKSYKKGQIIHGLSEECLGQFCVISGEIRAYIVSEDGREITLYRMRDNETCVISASCVISQITFETQLVAETDCEMYVLGSGVFSKLTEDNIYVKCYMYELLTKRFSRVMFVMQQIIFLGFDRRLASFLISEYETTNSIEIRMTHEQIAMHTNSAREVVARMLKRFSNDGLVEYKRGVIVLKDLQALYDIM